MNSLSRIAFFHGLESASVSQKSQWLHERYENAFTPAMDYSVPGLFENMLEEVRQRDIELLIGSSMGGWFAYCLSTHTGMPTVLFNPALHSRRIEPAVSLGNTTASHIVVLGRNDEIIKPEITLEWVNRKGPEHFTVFFEDNAHRTPLEIFARYVLDWRMLVSR